MEEIEKAHSTLNVEQRIKEVQVKMNYCVQMNNQDGDESFKYWNNVMKELLVVAEFLKSRTK